MNRDRILKQLTDDQLVLQRARFERRYAAFNEGAAFFGVFSDGRYQQAEVESAFLGWLLFASSKS